MISGALTDVTIQGMEALTEGKPFSPIEVVLSGTLAMGGQILGEAVSARIGNRAGGTRPLGDRVADPPAEGGTVSLSAGSTTSPTRFLPPLDDLAAAADMLDPAGGGKLTYAGRAAAKHSGRPGSAFPQPRGTPEAINVEGQRIVREILNDPQATLTTRFQPRYGHYMDIRASNGMGIRYTVTGRFIGFLEP